MITLTKKLGVRTPSNATEDGELANNNPEGLEIGREYVERDNRQREGIFGSPRIATLRGFTPDFVYLENTTRNTKVKRSSFLKRYRPV